MSIGILSDVWAVDGTPIYEPTMNLPMLHTSISSDDSGRTEDGVMHNTWVRPDMIKASMVWQYLTGQEVELLVSLMQGKEFTLRYKEFGKVKSAYVYVAEINYTMMVDAGYADEGGVCTGISANAVQI